MTLIEFKNLPNTTTPLKAENLNNNFNSIVESGSNENGNWVKFSDGTMICEATIIKNIENTIPWNNFYIGEVFNIPFAQSFATLHSCNIDIYSTKNMWKMSGNVPNLNGTGSFYTISPESFTTDVNFHIKATGKWK